MSSNPVADNFLTYAARRMQMSQTEIHHCAARLTEAQLWHRNGDHENSIANLLLHLEGNIRQWILHGVAAQPDVRQRDAEFTLQPTHTSQQALSRFDAAIAAACNVLPTVTPARLLVVIDPQPNGTWRHATILEAIFKVVGHLEHHTGQIILLTKQMAATDLDLSMPRKR